MTFSRRTLVTVMLGATAALAGCSTSGLTQGTVVLDVRTPAEFASGHLEGATNIDVQAPSFASRIATLDKHAAYFVYCHSGNRAAQAITRMQAAGFTGKLTNGGGITAASQTSGLKIVS